MSDTEGPTLGHADGKTYHRRREPCCEDEARRYLAALAANPAPAGLDARKALDSALAELDNIRWDDIWPHLYGGSPSSQELARMSMKYVGYVRADIQKARATLDAANPAPEKPK